MVKRSFFTNAVIYGIGGVLGQLGGVVLLPLYTHYLNPAEYGIMDIIERVGGIVNICLMVGGLRQATLAFYLQAKEDSEREKIAITISTFIAVIFCMALFILYFGASVFAGWIKISDERLLVFGVITVVSECFLVVPLALMQARMESISFVVVNLVTLVVRVGLAILFVGGFGWKIWGVYLALFSTYIVIGSFLTLREVFKSSFLISWSKLKDVSQFSLPFIPTGIFFFVLYNGDRFFLLKTAGPEEVGIYALACRIASCVGMVAASPLFKVWTAEMYGVFKGERAEIIAGQMLTRIMVAYTFVGIGLILFSRELLTFVSSSAYMGSASLIAPLVLANAFLIISNYFECVFYVFHRTSLKPFTAFFSAVVIIIAYALLIPPYSYHGAAYATLIGYFFMALITYRVTRKVFVVQYQIFNLFTLLAISFAITMLSLPLEVSIKGFLLRCCLLVIWGAGVWFSGVVSSDDKEMAKRKIGIVYAYMKKP